MHKTVFAIFFAGVFAAFLVVPSVMAAVNDNFDISVLAASSEEEETHVKDFEIKPVFQDQTNNTIFTDLVEFQKTDVKNYNSLAKELVLPPPENLGS
ncbi:hypothetical protein ACFSQP_06135 [Bizionia sediminis]|uniref:Secreted protein n=1 Tax=Bizionia sediminis TaxID=1737064 RepID=A0ABW5KRB3_9FLAO